MSKWKLAARLRYKESTVDDIYHILGRPICKGVAIAKIVHFNVFDKVAILFVNVLGLGCRLLTGFAFKFQGLRSVRF